MWSKTRDEARDHLTSFGERVDRNYGYMLELDDEFPELGLFQPTCISAEVGPGWVNLLRPLLIALRDARCHITQLKQKFCELRVYWDWPDDVTQEERTAVREAESLAVELSLHACENCGDGSDVENPGKIMAGRRRCGRCREAPRTSQP